MDELETLRRCHAAPNDPDPQLRQAIQDNPAAAQAAEQARRFEQQLRQTLEEPAIPQGLQGRIMLRAGLAQRRRRRQRMTAGFALAASVLLSVTLSLRTPAPTAEQGFGELALAHVHEELAHLEHASGSVTPSTAAALFRQVGAQVTGDLGSLRFAFICPTPQGPGLHLVADSAQGPVTVLYVPEASAPQQWRQFADARFSGRALGYAQGGALAIIGEDELAVAQVASRFASNVDWQARQASANRHLALSESPTQTSRTQT